MFRNKIKITIKKKDFTSIFFSFIFILTFILILFNKTDYFLVNKIKGSALDYTTPLTSFISSPIDVFNNVGMRLISIKNTESENLRLKQEIIRLKKWQTLAIKNSRENRVFKKLLNSTSHNIDIIKTASVTSQSTNLYTKLFTINAGSKDGINKNLAVINEKGLVGKTIFVSNNNTRVLMVNDSSSSIPVKTLSNGSFSILEGSSDGKFLKSAFIKDSKLPKIGDLLVTSGNAKIFPRDILVAKVIDVKEDFYYALPYVDFNDLNYVQVVRSK